MHHRHSNDAEDLPRGAGHCHFIVFRLDLEFLDGIIIEFLIVICLDDSDGVLPPYV
jgi:hypothetical protein